MTNQSYNYLCHFTVIILIFIISNIYYFIFIILTEEVRAQQAAVDELAARLSSAEEPTAVHPGETGV